eukprot:CAMPEP_0201725680 /NCGR_PEP_ID=MMETSP0593-20130828/9010_1 /ASSEMBLY_ACC=CAM_ASM_000672 /TAXON_ID=267983 /ORGANISM="Skeletonema japonicum, Strain CCMP2506" /LENGTH=255 /DNA_ID=CAMNT_0048217109 /DNA_START=382 /DNA_END=1149 /DNA_ORIENTATION=+
MLFIRDGDHNILTHHYNNSNDDFILCLDVNSGILFGAHRCNNCNAFTGSGLPGNTQFPRSVCHSTSDCRRLKREGSLSKNKKSKCCELLQRVEALNGDSQRDRSTMNAGTGIETIQFAQPHWTDRCGVRQKRFREPGWLPNPNPPIGIDLMVDEEEVEDIDLSASEAEYDMEDQSTDASVNMSSSSNEEDSSSSDEDSLNSDSSVIVASALSVNMEDSSSDEDSLDTLRLTPNRGLMFSSVGDLCCWLHGFWSNL